MGVKLRPRRSDDIVIGYTFLCPGCKYDHTFYVQGDVTWKFDGNMESPTIHPSLLCDASTPERRCHLWVKNGQIQFLQDCHHELKGQIVPMVDVDE